MTTPNATRAIIAESPARAVLRNGQFPRADADAGGWTIDPNYLESVRKAVEAEGWDCGEWEGIQSVLLHAEAALATSDQADSPGAGGVPAGWKLMPEKPTPEMLKQIGRMNKSTLRHTTEEATAIYVDVLAASPKPPTTSDAAGDLRAAVLAVDYDGFVGTVVGSYTTREGKDGVVLQQVGTRVVHVYGKQRVRLAEPVTGAGTGGPGR